MDIEEEYNAFQRKASIALAAKQDEIDRLRGVLADILRRDFVTGIHQLARSALNEAMP